jgi:RNA polymerase sigma-70 factor (ECF subfamily)
MAGDPIAELIGARRYEEAFDRLLAHFERKVFALAYSMLGDHTAAEEAAQEAFIRIWKSLSGFRGRSQVSTWVYAITRNVCLTALRPRPVRMVSLDEPAVRREAEAWPSAAPERAGGPDVMAAVAALPERYRRVLVLYYVEQKSYEEVARMLDLPLGTVKTWIHRAKKELALALRAVPA